MRVISVRLDPLNVLVGSLRYHITRSFTVGSGVSTFPTSLLLPLVSVCSAVAPRFILLFATEQAQWSAVDY